MPALPDSTMAAWQHNVGVALLLLACIAPAGPTCAQANLETAGQIAAEVDRLWKAGDFGAIDALRERLSASGERTLSGWPKIEMLDSTYARIFNNQLRDPLYWRAQEAPLRWWLEKSPRSVSGNIGIASLYLARAWAERGPKVASGVSEQEWRRFREYLAKAREALDAQREFTADTIAWHIIALGVARVDSRPAAQVVRVIEEAVRRFPTATTLQAEALVWHEPQWGGSADAIESFAAWAAANYPAEERDSAYSTLYVRAFKDRWPGHPPLRVDCSRFLSGTARTAARYPTSFNRNEAAFAAYTCKDRHAARRYFELLGDATPPPGLWHCDRCGPSIYPEARAWAFATDAN